ncbi:MAG TPA: hypothetical protein PLE99_11050 [Candidatus Thiothrix moscowensis]|uniref:hypothetical protein n=1 Tax=unclassified Thiothrix TaxID=2636184 RepID=UPI001A319E48|nr:MULTISPECIES: hypothetical protein [unclassified Thiothrix]MBJ6608957.1 hypothetical protein [Candidatus Thiothrix moscowensis]HRJ53298.1 hypothetical protein [Candidatus Thiothrix moscowensis]HRJ94137.1 hypothetical protein [Candidatus Thiothrix moscowensis]
MNRKELASRGKEQYRRKPQLLLDGLIIHSRELGELGKQLERLLRQHGVRSSLDSAFSARYH